MSRLNILKELEIWNAALNAYEEVDFEKALELFSRIDDSSKVLVNMALIYAVMGKHELALERLADAVALDQYLAVGYFQIGICNFHLARYKQACEAFADALLYLRGNEVINYGQLGFKFRLYSAEILFNQGLCLIYMGHNVEGLALMEEAKQVKLTVEHDVIDAAIVEGGEGYSVFSIPVGLLYRPSEKKMSSARVQDYYTSIHRWPSTSAPQDAPPTGNKFPRVDVRPLPPSTGNANGPIELTKIRVKLYYADDVRGMAVSPEIPYAEFMARVVAKFDKEINGLSLRFKNVDGGKMSLRDESDYALAIKTVRESSMAKSEGRLEIWCTDN
ncbi:NADPH oxidase regulator NoxR [Mycena venus]|uniref:NADPH oxidase regulator NoxR n=1 Tax=Mycena venus TaxID=2733690 RepID=A0A8H7CFB0_9AGAR|nr:NADPH oxidase regulator NoxR [Mycena venus]